jgi:hypothetical protein
VGRPNVKNSASANWPSANRLAFKQRRAHASGGCLMARNPPEKLTWPTEPSIGSFMHAQKAHAEIGSLDQDASN